MKEIWTLLSSKIHLQKVFMETGTVEKAANHKAFQVEGLELGYGYILNNGIVEREGLLGHSVYEVLKDLVETLEKENDPYKVVAELIYDGYKIEINSKDEIYYYSKFHSSVSFPLVSEYTFEEAKRVEMSEKGVSHNQSIEILNVIEDSAVEIENIYAPLNQVNEVRDSINKRDVMKEVWILLSSKVHLQKVFVESRTVEKAANHKAFQVEGLELGNGYILNNGIIEREGLLELSVYEVLKDLVKTIGKENDPYKVVAELIYDGYKIEMDIINGYCFYSEFYSPYIGMLNWHSQGKFPLNIKYTFEEAKQAMKELYKNETYKKMVENTKGGLSSLRNQKYYEKIIKDDKAFQYLVEYEFTLLAEYIMEMLKINDFATAELISDLFRSLNLVNELRNAEVSKRKIRRAYKQRLEIQSKGAFCNTKECQKIIKDDKAFQYIVENEMYLLGEYIMEILNIDEMLAEELIEDICTSHDQINRVRGNRMLPPLTTNEDDVLIEEVWILLSSKVFIQKVLIETGSLEKAANHEAFQVEDLELGYGYVLNNGFVEREGLLGIPVYEVLNDLVETLEKEDNAYKVMAELIISGSKIEIDSKEGVYYYSKFYSPGRINFDTEYTYEDAKIAMRLSYKKIREIPSKGAFDNPKECQKIIRDDVAIQYIVENELYVLGDYIMELLNIDEDSAADLIEDLYTSIDQVYEVINNNRISPPFTIDGKCLDIYWD